MSSKVKKNNYIAWVVIIILILVLVSQQGAFTYKDRSIEAAGADVTITLGDYKKTLEEFKKQLEDTLTQIDVAIKGAEAVAKADSKKTEAINTRVIPAFKALKAAVKKELALIKELLAKLAVDNYDEKLMREQTQKIATQISSITYRITTLIFQVANSSYTIGFLTIGALDPKTPSHIPGIRERFGTIATKEEIKNYQGWWVYVIGDKSYYLLDSKGNKISVARNIFAQAVYYKKDGELISFTIYDQLLEQITNLDALKNKLDNVADETTPIISPEGVSKDRLERIEELRESIRDKEKILRENPTSSFNLINFLAQAPRPKPLPDKSKPPTTNAEADKLILELEKKEEALMKKIGEKPITDPPVISDGEIKIPVDEAGNIIGTFCVDKKGKTDCVIEIQVCTKSGCSRIEIKISLEALIEYKKNKDFKIIEDEIREGLPKEYEDLKIQPPFDDLEQKLADKIKERDAEIANKIKLYRDLIAHIRGNYKEIYPNTPDGTREANDQVAFLLNLLERLEKERLEGSKKK